MRKSKDEFDGLSAAKKNNCKFKILQRVILLYLRVCTLILITHVRKYYYRFNSRNIKKINISHKKSNTILQESLDHYEKIIVLADNFSLSSLALVGDKDEN